MQTVHLSCIKIRTISKQTGPRFHMSPFTKEYHRVRPKQFLSLWCIRLMQTVHISFIKISTISKQTEPSFQLSLFTRSTMGNFHNDFWAYGALGTNHAPILHRNKYYLQLDLSEIPYDTLHLVVPSGASTVPLGVSKLISEHMLCSMKTVHLSCIKIRTISKQTEPRFHMSLFTKQYHRVCPK